jgi:hypothetical protein
MHVSDQSFIAIILIMVILFLPGPFFKKLKYVIEDGVRDGIMG